MNRANPQTILRIAAIAAVLLLAAGYVYWKTGKTYLYAEVEPGFVYQCGMRSADETINAANACRAQTLLMLMPSQDQFSPIGSAVTSYGFRSKLTVASFGIENDTISRKNVAEILSHRAKPRRRPLLLISPDGKLAGMAAAAYRLTGLKMPLDKVLELAAVPGASEETTQAIRDFATRYAADMETTTTRPATAPAEELQPAGPAVR